MEIEAMGFYFYITYFKRKLRFDIRGLFLSSEHNGIKENPTSWG